MHPATADACARAHAHRLVLGAAFETAALFPHPSATVVEVIAATTDVVTRWRPAAPA